MQRSRHLTTQAHACLLLVPTARPVAYVDTSLQHPVCTTLLFWCQGRQLQLCGGALGVLYLPVGKTAICFGTLRSPHQPQLAPSWPTPSPLRSFLLMTSRDCKPLPTPLPPSPRFGFTTIVVCGAELYTSLCAYMTAAWWEGKVGVVYSSPTDSLRVVNHVAHDSRFGGKRSNLRRTARTSLRVCRCDIVS